MTAKAIALCRVSTEEQRQNNSLNRQRASVDKAAQELGVDIIKVISGVASSKVGKNFERKDLTEIKEFCARNKQVKYLIIDEVDRFMRSTGEMHYWLTVLKYELNVKVHFASRPELNDDNAQSRLLLSLDSFKAESSNEDRQNKSIRGHEQAIREGRYTFQTKPGYTKGTIPGVHIPHPVTFAPLQKAFKEVLSGLYTPLEARKRLNESAFGTVHTTWRSDKFIHFATDPYYAGIIGVDVQVKASNQSGQHEAMLTIEEHQQLVSIFSAGAKHPNPKKQYNPEYPMNKILLCGECDRVKFTGSTKNNGYARKTTTYYHKYRCRGCGKEYHRDTVHDLMTEKLKQLHLPTSKRAEIADALAYVWGQKKEDNFKEIKSLEKRVTDLEVTKSQLVLELVRTDERLKPDLEKEIGNIKDQIEATQARIDKYGELEDDLIDFVKFGLEYTNDVADDWWDLDHESRVQCQQLIFPGGITFNSDKKVGTTQLSPFYTLEPNKKDLRIDRKSLMVELQGVAPWSAGLSWLVVYRLRLFKYLKVMPLNNQNSMARSLKS